MTTLLSMVPLNLHFRFTQLEVVLRFSAQAGSKLVFGAPASKPSGNIHHAFGIYASFPFPQVCGSHPAHGESSQTQAAYDATKRPCGRITHPEIANHRMVRHYTAPTVTKARMSQVLGHNLPIKTSIGVGSGTFDPAMSGFHLGTETRLVFLPAEIGLCVRKIDHFCLWVGAMLLNLVSWRRFRSW